MSLFRGTRGGATELELSGGWGDRDLCRREPCSDLVDCDTRSSLLDIACAL